MASVWEKRGVWYGAFKDERGLRHTRRLLAKNKTEARHLAFELEQQAWKRRQGLEASPGDASMTLGALATWWLKSRCPKRSHDRESSRLKRYIIGRPIGELLLPQVTTTAIEQLLFAQEAAGLSGSTANHTRATLRTIFNRARKAGIWTAPNPVADVERRREIRRAYSTLSADEVPAVLAELTDEWRPLFAAALYTGMRRGELLGLRRCDVDLEGKVLVVARSWDFDTTKGGHADAIDIAEPLIPYLRAAMKASPSELVFPGPKGRMRRPDVPLEDVLRSAMARAHLVEGWDHVCRRCKARKRQEHTWRYSDQALRTCPSCGMKLWPRAVVRPIRFHDLRHTTATLLLRAGVPPQFVQRLLRHRSITTTTGTYGHLNVEDLREALKKLPAPPAMEAPQASAVPVGTVQLPAAAPNATRLLPGEPSGAHSRVSADENSEDSSTLPVARQGRLELPTYGLEGRCSILVSYWRKAVLLFRPPNSRRA